MKKISLILFFSIISINLFSQKIGQWNTHFSYERTLNTIVQGKDVIYALTDGKLFSYNPSDESVETYYKATGNDNITHIAYSKKNECLVIVRENVDIDLLYSNNNFVYISGLKDITENIDKKVNDIFIKDNYAYLSTNFGLLILNLEKQEIKETVKFRYPFYSVCIHDNWLYAATNQGTLRIDLNNNIQYLGNWEKVSLSSKYNAQDYTFADHEIRYITSFDNKLTFLIPFKALYYLQNNIVERFLGGNNPEKFINSGNHLIVSNPTHFWDFPSLNNQADPIWANGDTLKCIIPHESKANEYWAGLGEKGLSVGKGLSEIKVSTDNNSMSFNLSNIKPAGPLSNYPFFMTHEHEQLLVVGGAAGGNGSKFPGRFSRFKQNHWINYSKSEIDKATGDNAIDFLSVISHPTDPNHFYICTWDTTGLYEIKHNSENIEYKLYNNKNSTLENLPNGDKRLRINGMAFDDKNNLWLLNSMVKNTVKILKSDGTWTKIYYPQIDDEGKFKTNIKSLLIDKYKNKWITTCGQGNNAIPAPYLFLFNENGTIENTADDKTKYITAFYDQDNKPLPIKEILKTVEDHNGNIWVGTDAGIFVVYNSSQLLNDPNKNIVFNKVKIPRNDGTNNADILLENIRIIDIKIDGGNRKWIATPIGVYAVSANAQETIHNFTTDNSPLPSSNILSLAIDPESGIVYMGSEKGMVSYRAEATEGEKSFSNVYAFPNPVKPEYEGPITITGLKANSTVKITDIRGNLINQGTSIGGQYIWNGRNQKKEKVETGVYVVFGSSEDGKEGVVTKIMVVN